MIHRTFLLILAALFVANAAFGAARLERYYAHDTVEDVDGVIAPWYTGQNGLLDFRVRVSAETLKRYPWVDAAGAVMAAPHFVYTSMWSIDKEGKIGVPPLDDWMCGDLGQRTVSIVNGMADYYRYSGDPAVIAFIVLQADYILAHALTPPDHPWPAFPISVPTKGKPYGTCNPDGMIQLDLSADIGTAILRAYQITGDTRYLDAARGWGDLFAEHANLTPGQPTWNRYANPESSKWSNELTGSVTLILRFLDMLIRLGHTGADGAIVKARDAGRAWLETSLLPQWTAHDTWGRYYWDWECPVYSIAGVWAAQYILDSRDAFPSWKTDARNILTLMINRTGVDPASAGEVYSGAWAVPESPSCCGKSLSYGQQILASGLAQYSVLADDPLTREMARRMAILGAYDALDNGAVIDGLDGAPIVAGTWLNIIHPLALRFTLHTMSWLPELFGPPRENHIMRSSSEIVSVTYGARRVACKSFDAPKDTLAVLRLAFAPASVTGDDQPLPRRDDLAANGYTVALLSNGDCVVSVRHDGLTSIVVEGADPQETGDSVSKERAGNAGETRSSPGVQRMVFGYAGRTDLRDAAGNEWKPATEWIVRLGTHADSVAAAWWTSPAPGDIQGAASPDLYRYGAHAPAFMVNVTAASGPYYAILKFAATRDLDTTKNLVTVSINGEKVVDKMDVAAKAGGANKALDIEFHGLKPKNGIIEFRFEGGDSAAGIAGDAFIQALEVGPDKIAG